MAAISDAMPKMLVRNDGSEVAYESLQVTGVPGGYGEGLGGTWEGGILQLAQCQLRHNRASLAVSPVPAQT